MRFTKMQGTGNDYIYVNCLAEETGDRPALAARLSNRNFGVGGDGLICICPSDIADFKMDMYNADGSAGQMCGNGIRCLGKYVYDRGMTDKTSLTIETGAGLRYLELFVKDGSVESVRVDMSAPVFTPSAIPLLAEGDDFIGRPVEVLGRVFRVTALSVGNPHAVVFLGDVENFDLAAYGPLFERHELFPERVNTEFVEVLAPDRLRMRVWERGSGETLACGTGATAALCAAVVNGLAGNRATVELRGGELVIEWDREADRLYMTGPAVTVFDGELY